VDWDPTGLRILSYECPFGVGYLEAILHDSADDLRSLLPIARESIAARLAERGYDPPATTTKEAAPWGVFVTLHDPAHAVAGDSHDAGDPTLRGCMGHVDLDAHACLGKEVAECAALAAFADPRFPKLNEDELHRITLEVSVLGAPAEVGALSELDPRRFGVVVRSGKRRGLLLPGIPGINTPEDQVMVALRKGEIRPTDPWTVERFPVRKVSEATPPRETPAPRGVNT
jgi:AMMECR1 domain-containing protein